MHNKNVNKKLILVGCGVLAVGIAVFLARPAILTAQLSSAMATSANTTAFQSHNKIKPTHTTINALATNSKIKQIIDQKTTNDMSGMLVDAFKLDKKNQFKNTKTNKDENGKTHARYQQTYDGIPVWGADVIVHADQNGNIKRITDRKITGLETKLASIDLKNPNISSAQALNSAKQKASDYIKNVSVDQLSFRGEKTDMAIFVDGASAHQVYHVNYVVEAPDGIARPNFMIDAQTGVVLKQWDGLAADLVGTGPGGNQKIGLHEYGTTPGYDFLDVVPSALNINCTMTNRNEIITPTPDPVLPDGYVSSVNLQQGTQKYIPWVYPCFRNDANAAVNGGYSPTNDAHFYGKKTAEMYKDWLDVLPTDDGDSETTDILLLRARYNIALVNAFWDGTYVSFGDGDNTTYPLSSAADIVGHETSHAFTEFNSDLNYEGESGGINEAFSDIAGEALEFYWKNDNDWLVGADAVKAKNKALRYFQNPRLDGVSITHKTQYTTEVDVHNSSGIFNRAAYLIAHLPGWDTEKMFKVFAAANQNEWSASSDFVDASCGVLNATVDAGLDPDPVRAAFESVGVFCNDDRATILDVDNDGMSDTWEAAQTPPFSTAPFVLTPTFSGVGNGTLTNLTSVGAVTETWTIQNIGATLFSVVGSVSGAQTNAQIGTLYNNGKIAFKINSGSTAFSLNDTFTVVVSNNDEGSKDYDSDGFSNIEEYKAGSDPQNKISVPIKTLFGESFEGEKLPTGWTTTFGSDIPWTPKKNYKTATDLYYSLVANPKPGQYSQVEFSANFVDGSKLTFDSLVQTTTGLDIAKIYIDGEFVDSSSGVFTDWQHPSIDMTGGWHTVLFQFSRAATSPNGSKDAPGIVYMDNIQYEHYEADTDGDGLGNSIDTDDDNDGALDVTEIKQGTKPLVADSDGDGFLDGVDPYPSDGARIGIQGTAAIANLGGAVATADVDGDGNDDVVVGSYKEDPVNQSTGLVMKDAGTVKVYSGKDGTLLYRWLGEAAGDNFGVSVANAGDVNNDGKDDIIIGATGYDPTIEGGKKLSNAGAAYVYSGAGGAAINIPWIKKFEGKTAGDNFGIAVAGGNIDGDANNDLIVGANLFDPVDIAGKKMSGAGRVYAYSGSSGAEVHYWDGELAGDVFGSAVATGDVNNDGLDDVIVGAPKHDVIASTTLKDAGTVYAYYAYSVSDYVEIHRWDGEAAGDAFGSSIAVGNIDADAGSDIVIGAPMRDVGALKDVGAIYAYSGIRYALLPSLTKTGSAAGDAFGSSVAVGEIDATAGNDIVVGVCKSDYTNHSLKVFKDAGSVSVYSGLTGASLVTASPLTGTSASQWFGCAVATGDTNKDGVADVIVGSPNADPSGVKDAGSVEIYPGNQL